MIAMWGREAQLYMAVNERGEVYATVSRFLFQFRICRYYGIILNHKGQHNEIVIT